jgi:hypothetical protein
MKSIKEQSIEAKIIKRVEQDTVIECGDGTEFLVSRIDNKETKKTKNKNIVIQDDITLPKKKHK